MAVADAAMLKAHQVRPSKFAEWAGGKGAVVPGCAINLDCFLLNVPNVEEAPELVLTQDDLAAILANNPEAIKAKYPNAHVEVREITDEFGVGQSSGLHLYRLILSL